MSIDHAMAIGGFIPVAKELPKVGVTVIKIRWDGCMAHVRSEIDTGDLLAYKMGPIPSMLVRWDKNGEQWESLDNVRIVNGATEVWI